MLYNLLYPLVGKFPIFSIVEYITFRAAGGVFTSLLLSLTLGEWFIAKMRIWQKRGQPIREDGPQQHLLKVGTPTMGGLLILFSSLTSTFLWSDIKNPYIWLVILTSLGYGLIGFIDDYLKLYYYNSRGLPGKVKFLLQAIIALSAYNVAEYLSASDYQAVVIIPFFKNVIINLGIYYYIFAIFVVVGASNAVNLTDGLDGLAIIPTMIAAACFCFISYLIGNIIIANYLQLHYIKDVGEISIFCASLIGAGLGFLWFNAPPAKIIMGDVGSLALGGAIGIISIITKQELVLAIIGGVFVIEVLSVMIQVLYYKYTGGKRVFLMSPIHHHFEKKGWSEATIVIRFGIIAVIFAILGLFTLKLK